MSDTKVGSAEVLVTQEEAYRFSVTFPGRDFSPIVTDEGPPLGKDAGPNPARLLGAALANCLAASLTFCLGRRGAKVTTGISAHVEVDIVRTPEKRQRIGQVRVKLETPPGVDPAALDACRDTFEDFCTVTASVRRGIDVQVEVAG